MPSNQTSNYALSQWSKDDQILMDDFNADNAKIDAAIKAETNARAAAVNAINTTLAKKIQLTTGQYTGDGQAARIISVGFTPKAVFVTTVDGYSYAFSNGFGPSAPYGGLAVTGHPAGAVTAYPAVEIVSGGFRVSYRTENPANYTNSANQKYNYIALG